MKNKFYPSNPIPIPGIKEKTDEVVNKQRTLSSTPIPIPNVNVRKKIERGEEVDYNDGSYGNVSKLTSSKSVFSCGSIQPTPNDFLGQLSSEGNER